MMSRKTRSLINDACCNSIAKMTSVLRQASQIFRRDFIESGNIEVFLEALTIASACNKVLRKKFQKPETVGLIPAGVYSANNRYNKKHKHGSCIWNRRVAVRYITLETPVSTDLPNCRIIV
jgi:hypothetical protein